MEDLVVNVVEHQQRPVLHFSFAPGVNLFSEGEVTPTCTN